MRWQRVHGMELQPNVCVACGSNPATLEGEQQDAIFAEGVDIDWGNSLYLCLECANIVASLVERPPAEYVESVEKQLAETAEAFQDLKNEYEELQDELDKIREGTRAVRRVKETTRS